MKKKGNMRFQDAVKEMPHLQTVMLDQAVKDFSQRITPSIRVWIAEDGSEIKCTATTKGGYDMDFRAVAPDDFDWETYFYRSDATLKLKD